MIKAAISWPYSNKSEALQVGAVVILMLLAITLR
jgi:hypothetical protein